jgi:hypothetical protein
MATQQRNSPKKDNGLNRVGRNIISKLSHGSVSNATISKGDKSSSSAVRQISGILSTLKKSALWSRLYANAKSANGDIDVERFNRSLEDHYQNMDYDQLGNEQVYVVPWGIFGTITEIGKYFRNEFKHEEGSAEKADTAARIISKFLADQLAERSPFVISQRNLRLNSDGTPYYDGDVAVVERYLNPVNVNEDGSLTREGERNAEALAGAFRDFLRSVRPQNGKTWPEVEVDHVNIITAGATYERLANLVQHKFAQKTVSHNNKISHATFLRLCRDVKAYKNLGFSGSKGAEIDGENNSRTHMKPYRFLNDAGSFAEINDLAMSLLLKVDGLSSGDGVRHTTTSTKKSTRQAVEKTVFNYVLGRYFEKTTGKGEPNSIAETFAKGYVDHRYVMSVTSGFTDEGKTRWAGLRKDTVDASVKPGFSGLPKPTAQDLELLFAKKDAPTLDGDALDAFYRLVLYTVRVTSTRGPKGAGNGQKAPERARVFLRKIGLSEGEVEEYMRHFTAKAAESDSKF